MDRLIVLTFRFNSGRVLMFGFSREAKPIS